MWTATYAIGLRYNWEHNTICPTTKKKRIVIKIQWPAVKNEWRWGRGWIWGGGGTWLLTKVLTKSVFVHCVCVCVCVDPNKRKETAEVTSCSDRVSNVCSDNVTACDGTPVRDGERTDWEVMWRKERNLWFRKEQKKKIHLNPKTTLFIFTYLPLYNSWSRVSPAVVLIRLRLHNRQRRCQ